MEELRKISAIEKRWEIHSIVHHVVYIPLCGWLKENCVHCMYRRKTRNSGFAFTSPQKLLSACHFFHVLFRLFLVSLFYQFGRSCSLRTRARVQCFFFFVSSVVICFCCCKMRSALSLLRPPFPFFFYTHSHFWCLFKRFTFQRNGRKKNQKEKVKRMWLVFGKRCVMQRLVSLRMLCMHPTCTIWLYQS